MTTVHVRKQGGAAIMTIPAHILDQLDIEVGATLEIELTESAFIVHLPSPKNKKRYTLAELLRGTTPSKLEKLHEDAEWFRDSEAAGREL